MPFTNSLFALRISVFIVGLAACSFAKAPDADSAATIEWGNKSVHLAVLDNSGWSSHFPRPKAFWFQPPPGNIKYTMEPGVRRLRLSCDYLYQTTTFLGLKGPATRRTGQVVIDADLKPLGQYTIWPRILAGRCVPDLIDQNGASVGAIVERNDSYDLMREMFPGMFGIGINPSGQMGR